MIDTKNDLLSDIALFRYSVLAEIAGLERLGYSRKEAVRLVCDDPPQNHKGFQQALSPRTVARWQARYNKQGLGGLEPSHRPTITTSDALPKELIDYLIQAKTDDEQASIPELIKRARAHEIIHPHQAISRVSVWRLFRRLGLTTSRSCGDNQDQRRFAKSHRMQMVLADFVHFKVGLRHTKRLALYLLDDAARFCLGMAVTTDGESADLFLKELNNVLGNYGLMDTLSLDRGPAFTANDVKHVLAALDIKHILGKRRYPPGHGKIERFNRSARARVLRSLDGCPDTDPAIDALTLRLRFDAFKVYNHTPHEKLAGKTPYQVFFGDPRPLRPAPSGAWLAEHFTLKEQRTVTNDNTISWESTPYEMPRGYARKKVTILRRVLEDDQLYFPHQGKLVRLHPVDLVANADGKRARPRYTKSQKKKRPAKSASALLFERHMASILDSQGGFTLPTKGDDNDQA